MVKIATIRSLIYKELNKQTLLFDKQKNLKKIEQFITFLTFFT